MPSWSPDRLEPAHYLPALELPVFYGDLDTNRHVNNVALGRYFEMGRLREHNDAGLNHKILSTGGHQLIARVAIDYLAECHMGMVSIGTRVQKVGRTSAVEEQAAWQHGRCVAVAEVVFVRMRESKPFEWPAEERAILESWILSS